MRATEKSVTQNVIHRYSLQAQEITNDMCLTSSITITSHSNDNVPNHTHAFTQASACNANLMEKRMKLRKHTPKCCPREDGK